MLSGNVQTTPCSMFALGAKQRDEGVTRCPSPRWVCIGPAAFATDCRATGRRNVEPMIAGSISSIVAPVAQVPEVSKRVRAPRRIREKPSRKVEKPGHVPRQPSRRGLACQMGAHRGAAEAAGLLLGIGATHLAETVSPKCSETGLYQPRTGGLQASSPHNAGPRQKNDPRRRAISYRK